MKPVFVACIVLLIARLGTAQPLADRVPADTMIYLGWSGTRDMPGFSGSHAEALLKESNLPAVFQQVLPQVIDRIAKDDPKTAGELRLTYDLCASLARYPTAVFFAGVNFDAREPIGRLGMVCRAGNDSEALRKRFQELIDQAPGDDVPAQVRVDGEDLFLLVGYAGETLPSGGASLATVDRFRNAISHLQRDPVFCAYADIEKLFDLLDRAVQSGSARDAQNVDEWNQWYPKVMDASGLRGLKCIAFSGGFDGRDWMMRSFLDAPAPRAGLLSLLDVPGISDEMLKAVPRSAEFFAVGAFDAARLITEIRSAVGKINPQWQQAVDQAIGAVTMALGSNVMSNVLEPLGPHWLAYAAPEVAGGGLAGLVAINRVDDAYKARGGLLAVSLFASNTAASLLAQNHAPITIRGSQVKYGDLGIYYIAAPAITPSWAMQGDFVVFGLYPQSVIGAARQITSAEHSILDEPAYQQLRARLQVQPVRGLSYANLPMTARSTYGALMFLSRLVGVADLFGIRTPPIVIPPFHVLQEHLSVSGSATWVDEAGMHSRSVSPFPGAWLLQGASGPQMLAALQTGILLPAVDRARQASDQQKCAANMRQIGMALTLHAAQH
ncbi:MAG: hypothetical protein NZ561_05700, partial [Phycisphaerae bacterium]|nr:hypothetical protein [Phycisphaerae bacterium]